MNFGQRRLITLVVAGVLMVLESSHIVFAQEKTLTFAYELKSNPPFSLGEGPDIDTQYPGATIEVLSLVAKRLGYKAEYHRMPWAQGLKRLKSNEIDGLFHASFKKKRMEIGVYPMKSGEVDTERSIMSQRYVLYKNKQSPLTFNGTQFESLSGPIGVIIGYSIIDDLQKMGVDVYKNSNIYSSMNMLLKRRVKGVVDLENSGDAFLRTNQSKFSEIIKTSPPIKQKPYYVMLSHGFVKKDSSMAEKIWDGIATIKKTGEYSEIIKKYDHLMK